MGTKLGDASKRQQSKEEIAAEIEQLEALLKAAREKFSEAHNTELRAKTLADRIIYAAESRCPCGAGLAYDPLFEDADSVFKGPLSGHWDCSAIMLGTADKNVKHTAQLPFSFYEVKSEKQPSARGATTRPK